METVEWRQIAGFPSYEISSEGVIRRRVPGRGCPVGYVLKPKIDQFGYVAITLSNKGRAKSFQVHRLVAEAFLGAPPSGRHEVAHGDGVKTNNSVGNLRWATKKENAADRARHGVWSPRKGRDHHAARLTEALVIDMRAAHANGEQITSIAARLGVPKLTAYDAIRRVTWKHLP